MTDMKERWREVAAITRRLQSEFPEQTTAYLKFLKDFESGGNLPPKHKELINVAIAVGIQCEWCIAFHVRNAARLGATRGELVEAGFQAIVMRGGPAFMWMTPLMQAIDEFVDEAGDGAPHKGAGK